MNSSKKILAGLLILIIGGVVGYFIGKYVPSASSGASVYSITRTKPVTIGSTGPTNPGCPIGAPCIPASLSAYSQSTINSVVVKGTTTILNMTEDACAGLAALYNVHYAWNKSNGICFLFIAANTNHSNLGIAASPTPTNDMTKAACAAITGSKFYPSQNDKNVGICAVLINSAPVSSPL